MPDSDAPLNVTVSTSTISLSMVATLQQSQPPDLSSIVHQINQFCQTRAGISTTSVCEGQIANPSPISHSLLINASTGCRPTAPPHQCLHVWSIPWSTPTRPQPLCLLQALSTCPWASLEPPLTTLVTSSQSPGTSISWCTYNRCAVKLVGC